ncbi:MAG TPA: glycoside hydrolase family 38 C-terminal domain-containing protein, partial [Gemmatimonadaceae bacterium]
WHVTHSTLPAYVDAVRRAAARDPGLETIAGELRAGEEYAPLLPGVLSARVYLKQANARVQRTLERWAEPLSAFAWIAGASYPDGALRYAWKTLLQNHPHDSICGCSVDAVHEENMTRFARAQQVADDLADRAAAATAGTLAPPSPGFARTIVFNTTGRPFSGIVDLTLDVPYESDEPGRHVDQEALDAPVTFWPREARPTSAVAADGTVCPFQILEASDAVAFVMSRYETPWALRVKRFQLAVEVSNLPGSGYMPIDWRICEDEPETRTTTEVDSGRASNGVLEIAVNPDGTVDVSDRRTGRRYERCGELVDEGDVGDEYTYSPPAHDLRVTSVQSREVSIERVQHGPLRHAFRIDTTLPVPARAASDRQSRVADMVPMKVSTVVTLDRGAEYAKWQITVDNRTEDHRLRVTFPAGVPRPGTAVADSAFGPVERPTAARAPVSAGRPVEIPVAYAPLQSFVATADARGGTALVADGLAEYEVLHGAGESRIALTLLRAVGALSRDDLATRPHGHAGPGLSTPGAQCLGTHTFNLAASPLVSGVQAARLYELAARVLAPPRAWTQVVSGTEAAGKMSIVEIDGDVVVSACKKAEDREAIVLRYFNPSAQAVEVRISLAMPIREAYVLNLREERQEPLPIVAGALQRQLRPFGIETVELCAGPR